MRKLLLIALLLIPSLSFGAITRVQSKAANTGATAAGSLNVVLDSAPTSGNILILAVSTNGTSIVTVPTSADIAWFGTTKGNTTAVAGQLFIGYVRTGSASATITLSLTTGTQPISAVCAEYSGFTRAVFDTSAVATGASTTLASGATPTTRSAAELWVAVMGSRANNTLTYSSPTNSFSIVGQTCTTITGTNADRACALLERIVSSTGTANAGATSDQSTSWVAYTVTLDEAATGGGATQVSYSFGQ